MHFKLVQGSTGSLRSTNAGRAYLLHFCALPLAAQRGGLGVHPTADGYRVELPHICAHSDGEDDPADDAADIAWSGVPCKAAALPYHRVREHLHVTVWSRISHLHVPS